LFSTAVLVAGLCGLLTGGLLVDRVGRRRLLCVDAIAAGCSALVTSFTGPDNPAPAAAALVLLNNHALLRRRAMSLTLAI